MPTSQCLRRSAGLVVVLAFRPAMRQNFQTTRIAASGARFGRIRIAADAASPAISAERGDVAEREVDRDRPERRCRHVAHRRHEHGEHRGARRDEPCRRKSQRVGFEPAADRKRDPHEQRAAQRRDEKHRAVAGDRFRGGHQQRKPWRSDGHERRAGHRGPKPVRRERQTALPATGAVAASGIGTVRSRCSQRSACDTYAY